MKLLKKLLLSSLFFFSAPALCAWETNLPRGVTPISREVYDLHMLILYICCAIGALVYGLIFYSVFAHRKSRHARPAGFSHSTAAEVAWTIIPFLILVAMAVPATKVLIKMENFSQSDITIKATAMQWRWQYEYEDENISFYSALDSDSNAASLKNPTVDLTTVDNYLLEVDKPMVVPVGKQVQMLLTSYDVIHAWWVPAFGMKRDAIPGYITRLWFLVDEPGVYRGQCAELCGRGHAYMPIVVHALPEEEYNAWLDTQRSGNSVASTGSQAPSVAPALAELPLNGAATVAIESDQPAAIKLSDVAR
ncbi:MAG: cytochrome c oxidase subunit II [Gammaproteobacteria bacterium]|nr:cytochrome c oxidase subunit II [Gammaproteobacteria bacterium]